MSVAVRSARDCDQKDPPGPGCDVVKAKFVELTEGDNLPCDAPACAALNESCKVGQGDWYTFFWF